MTSAKDLHQGAGQTGVFGEIFIVLGGLIGIFGAVFWVLSAMNHFKDSPAGAVAARADSFALGFFLFVEGLGFVIFGIMCLMAGWDRHKHPDAVH